MPDLTPRKGHILRIIISDYVATATPVASGAVARTEGLSLSAATVRHEMGELEDSGYILRPHTSAGSVPSNKGYRFFVDSLDPASQAQAGEAAHINSELGHARPDFETWSETAAAALASLLGALAFATPPKAVAAQVKSIELLKLQEMIIMLVVILREASVTRQLITLDRPVTGAELEHARNRLAGAVAGKTAEGIDAVMQAAMDPFDHQVLESTVGVLRQHDANIFGEGTLQGLARLLEQPELAARPDAAHDVAAAVEDSATFSQLASRTASDGTPTVLIGPENPVGTLREFSVLICRYGVPSVAQGLVGIVAPTRLQYQRAIPLVRHTSDALSSLAGQVFGTE